MKKIIFACVVTLLVMAKADAQSIEAIAIGTSLPTGTIKMKSTDGKELSIKDAMQKNGVLVMFSCNTCPVVGKYQARTQQVIAEVKAKGIGMIIVNSNEAQRSEDDSFEAMKKYAADQGYTAPYVLDKNSVVADAFGATRTPECFLFDANAKLVYHGAIDDNTEAAQAKRQHLSAAIAETISGKPVSQSNTRSVGCSIKRI